MEPDAKGTLDAKRNVLNSVILLSTIYCICFFTPPPKTGLLQKYYNGIIFIWQLKLVIVFIWKMLYNSICNNILSNYKEEHTYGNESDAKKSK